MPEIVTSAFTRLPELALFLSLAVGYAVGRIRFGPIQLGGVCGTLLAALAIGQFGVQPDGDIKNVFFALFIFALGYAGGPQFFANLNAKGLRIGLLSLIEIGVVLCLVLLATRWMSFDQGTAAGLMAGAATESAMVGTASEAIGKLPLAGTEIARLQANVVTAYSVTYLFGLVSIVLFTSQLAPILLRINLRDEAEALWHRMGGADNAGNALPALPEMVGRIYRVAASTGVTVGAWEAGWNSDAGIERVWRAGSALAPHAELTLLAGDMVLVVGHRAEVIRAGATLGPEQPGAPPDGSSMAVATTRFQLRSALHGTRLRQFREMLRRDGARSALHLVGIERQGRAVPLLPELELRAGDVVLLFGTAPAANGVPAAMLRRIRTGEHADLAYAAFGLVLGILLGRVAVTLGGIPVSLGTGGGALLTGLLFGWFQNRHPALGGIPPVALEVMKDAGLSVFIACVGLASGKQAIELLRVYGIVLPLLGIVVAMVPALISLFVGRYLLRLDAPVLLGAIAGQQCSTPALSAVLAAAGNTTPLLGYTITYAISNILLPLLGPVIVGLAGTVIVR